MKSFAVILAVLILTLCTTLVWATPFLVCAPTDQEVTHYLLKWDGADPEEVSAFVCENEEVMLKYNLKNISDGTHHVEVAAKNLWGQGEYVPFDFKRSKPGGPQGIGLSPE